MKPILPGPEARAPATLTDHLLEEILVRVRAPADLACATAACKTFRRLINDATFLRRYRSLHPPLLLGFVSSSVPFSFLPTHWAQPNARFAHAFVEPCVFLPVEAPLPNAAAARAVAAAGDFSFDYLPRRIRYGWAHCDARDGRFLLMSSEPEHGLMLPELAVCDPLTRGYLLLPQIPDDLVVPTLVQVQDENIQFFYAFFDPFGGYEEAQFRVMCWTRSLEMGTVFVYSSASGSWTHGTSVSWNALGLNMEPEDISDIGWWPSHAYGCLYWGARISNKLIKLNINSMEFTTVNLPGDYKGRDVVVVEAGEGRIGIFSLILDHDLRPHENLQPLRYSITMQNELENANERLVETKVPLPCEYQSFYIDGAAQGNPYIIAAQNDVVGRSTIFSLDIKTLKVERVCLTNGIPEHVIPYFGFPPFMSPRRM